MKKKGIDISSYQGNIDFEAVSKEVDFAIIRCGWGAGHYDKYADSYAVGCASHNIPFGFYWFSYALTPEMAKKEAEVAPAPEAPKGPTQEELLAEIRDLLKTQK